MTASCIYLQFPFLTCTLYMDVLYFTVLQICCFQLDMLSFQINYEQLICVSFMKIVLLIYWAWVIFQIKVVDIPRAIILFPLLYSLFSDICCFLDGRLKLEIESEGCGIFALCKMNGPIPESTCDLTSLVLYLKLIDNPLKQLLTNN